MTEAAAKLEEQEKEIVELKQQLQRLDTSMRLDPSHLLQASQERVMRASRELEAANVRHAFFSFYAPTELGVLQSAQTFIFAVVRCYQLELIEANRESWGAPSKPSGMTLSTSRSGHGLTNSAKTTMTAPIRASSSMKLPAAVAQLPVPSWH